MVSPLSPESYIQTNKRTNERTKQESRQKTSSSPLASKIPKGNRAGSITEIDTQPKARLGQQQTRLSIGEL